MKKIVVIASIATLAIIVTVFFFLKGNSGVDFNTQVKPVLNKKCIACHGGVKREADFSLLFRNEAMMKAESGKLAIVPGHPGQSELIRRITSNDPEVRMPYKKEPLTQDEIDILTQWIKDGAPWGDHWAYQEVKQQNVPSKTNWATTDVDAFVQEKLSEVELTPSAEASKEKLLRRVSLDLIGMPAPKNLRDNFLQSSDPKAYEMLVDSLLASKHYGERWAAVWMDLARYSDTKGYERDYIRTIWRYRDWLIKSFNRDMPYDSFLIEQLAGDLLPHPTDEQYIATAFHRNTMTNDEGGTENEEFRTAAVVDRINTTWESLMGTTFACVQCHSHPYDPFRHEEYYKFMAFFNNTRDEDTYEDYPVLRHFSETQQATLNELTEWIRKEVSQERADELSKFIKTWQPTSYSVTTDQYVNAALSDTKWLLLRRKSQARWPHVNTNNGARLIMRYVGYIDGGTLLIRTDKPDGPILAKLNVQKTPDWNFIEIPVTPTPGQHDLYLSYDNPRLKEDRDRGMLFDWIYFTNDLPWNKSTKVNKSDFWNLLTADTEVTPIMVENPQALKRVTQVFERGNWLVKGDTVSPDVPASLLKMPEGAPKNRFGLAMWLTDKRNPLVSRTIVNRVWEQIFGAGLAETLEDLGTQGIAPTHPELLDHLSWKLMNEYNWQLKALTKEIVMSSTYRQDSKVTEEHLQKDPFNRYYARTPRVRLSAEQVRDQALAVSGLLSAKMYGPGVMPYQPDGIWLSPYNGQKWTRSKGEDQYRRAVYTYWKRTAPYPSMMTFDGSAHEVCSARRIRTNTPLQALVTLNDSVYVEAATHLAAQMRAIDTDVRKQISHGYALALGHPPGDEELNVLVKLYEKISAPKMIKTKSTRKEESDEAMQLVASAILNLDEFITKN